MDTSRGRAGGGVADASRKKRRKKKRNLCERQWQQQRAPSLAEPAARSLARSHNAMHNVWLWGVDSEADHSRVTARENRGARFHRSVGALIKSS